MKKVILNKCYGGFGVSYKAYKLYTKKKGLNLFIYELTHPKFGEFVYVKRDTTYDIEHETFVEFTTRDLGEKVNDLGDAHLNINTKYREDPTLVEVVEELGKDANDRYSELHIVEIPDDVAEDYVIDDYDGIETLHKRVQVW